MRRRGLELGYWEGEGDRHLGFWLGLVRLWEGRKGKEVELSDVGKVLYMYGSHWIGLVVLDWQGWETWLFM